MTEPAVLHIDDVEGLHGGVFKRVGSTLGVTAFGLNVEQFPQGSEHYPDHDHSKDGQEEVYVILAGRATLTIDGEPHLMRQGSVALVPAGHSRRFTMPDGDVQILAIGGVPGTAFSDVIAAREKAATT